MPEQEVQIDPHAPASSRRRWLRGALGMGVGTLGGPLLGALCGPSAAAAAPLIQIFGAVRPNPARVFVAGPPAAVVMACLAPERMLGWPMPVSEAAKALLPVAARDKPMLGRLSGRGSTVSLEALLAMKPDLIIDTGTVDATYVSTAQRVADQTGVAYALVDGRLADSARQLNELGALLGVPARARALVAFAEEALGEAAQIRGGAGARPSVYLARGADGLETATAGSINAEIIEASGGRNVASTGRAGVARVSLEQVLGWAPDWVLTQDRNFFRAAQGDAVWRTLPAIREGRLLLAPDLPFGWLDGPPSVNRLLGVKWLAAHLRRGRPEGASVASASGAALATQAMNQVLREAIDDALRFHALFYGVTPSREAVQGWLDGRG